MRLIDADELLKHKIVPDDIEEGLGSDVEFVYVDAIKAAPTVSVQYARYGYWRMERDNDGNDYHVCPFCGKRARGYLNFCSYCGAYMKGDIKC